MSELIEKAKKAREASYSMALLNREQKDRALTAIADALNAGKDKIFEANTEDLKNAEAANLEKPLIKRLKFADEKLADVTDGILSLKTLEDPVGKQTLHTTLDDGLELYRVTCPIGVIGVIFESRPDALVQIATLCLKSGNAVFLKGGSEAAATNKVLSEIIYVHVQVTVSVIITQLNTVDGCIRHGQTFMDTGHQIRSLMDGLVRM